MMLLRTSDEFCIAQINACSKQSEINLTVLCKICFQINCCYFLYVVTFMLEDTCRYYMDAYT